MAPLTRAQKLAFRDEMAAIRAEIPQPVVLQPPRFQPVVDPVNVLPEFRAPTRFRRTGGALSRMLGRNRYGGFYQKKMYGRSRYGRTPYRRNYRRSYRRPYRSRYRSRVYRPRRTYRRRYRRY